ncbi:hypothetical protein C1H46_008622 [Malus baccata]|uniref:Uncharacterized protein n=1 Tax=Malus baccata TaxID=106549 RepID=A0A540N3S3_MALBA|nr:hypothetical protein C1H46_008622 [Malus baccata]
MYAPLKVEPLKSDFVISADVKLALLHKSVYIDVKMQMLMTKLVLFPSNQIH